MPSDATAVLTDELRAILANLAAGLFPLAKWIAEPSKYTPPQSDLPWRQPGRSLTPTDMGVIEFFEALLKETAGDAVLLARWAEIEANPLKWTPLADVTQWRAERGLQTSASFGITQSGNVPVDGDGKPLSRGDFYVTCWPLLVTAVNARKPADANAWEAFALELVTDRCPQWPTPAAVKSSTFVTQFARDLLYAMLGMRTALTDPWEFALLIELGEHRRVGNAYTPEDVRKTVHALRSVINTYAAKPAH